MTYNLNTVQFENDFYAIETERGNTIIFNLVDEQLLINDTVLNVNAVNVAVVDADGNYTDGVNVIGESNEFYLLNTAYTEYLGKPLNKDNLQYCILEVLDE